MNSKDFTVMIKLKYIGAANEEKLWITSDDHVRLAIAKSARYRRSVMSKQT